VFEEGPVPKDGLVFEAVEGLGGVGAFAGAGGGVVVGGAFHQFFNLDHIEGLRASAATKLICASGGIRILCASIGTLTAP
jgi:hypothetical protein